MRRRDFGLGGVAAALALGGAGMAWADANGPLLLLVGGPEGEKMSRWGDAFAQALPAGFPVHPSIVPQPTGGLDGVTAANRLDALVVPDGRTAAILPGAALLAWVAGDPRVHFDPTRWVPLASGSNSGVLVVRLPAGQAADAATLRGMVPLRIAADQPQSNDLAALLALARLGVRIAPVFGFRDTQAKTRAFALGEVDAVFLCGEGVPEDVAPLRASGGTPICSLGMLGTGGAIVPDPAFPALPEAGALGTARSEFLDGAYRAVAAAARTDFILVLPRLSDPTAVALWHGAAGAAIAAPSLAAAASASAIALGAAPCTAASLAALGAIGSQQSDLQAFLAKSFGWQPS